MSGRRANELALSVLLLVACSAQSGVQGAPPAGGGAAAGAGPTGAGMPGSPVGPSVSVVDTEPCYDAGCEPGLVCDGTACVTPPAQCAPGGSLACGADGHVYPSVCEANLVGVGVTPHVESCVPPDGYFVCLDAFCNAATSFCNESFMAAAAAGIARSSPRLGCLPLPAACAATPLCSCVAGAAEPPVDPCCEDASSGWDGVRIYCVPHDE